MEISASIVGRGITPAEKQSNQTRNHTKADIDWAGESGK
jgi:hypothetical protein